MAAPIYGQTCHPITPLVKPCSSTALRLYPSAYPSRMGSLILINQFNCGGVIFSLVFRPSRRFIFPAKSLVPTGTAFTVCPAYRFPVIPGRLNFPTRCQPSSSRCSARTCRLPGFYFLILFRRCSFLLYTQHQLASFSTDLGCQVCPQLNNCPMDAGTEEWFQLHVELDRRRAAT